MILKELFLETATDNKDLISLASAVLKMWNKDPTRFFPLSKINASNFSPIIKDLANNITIKFDSKFDRSLYNPKSKEILMKVGDNVKGDILHSELVHELQHALDDLKSAGRFRREKGDYMSRQSEVNARLAQTINDIELALKKLSIKNIDWKNPKVKTNIVKLINSYLRIHKLTSAQGIDTKRYQRLVNRVYNYLVNR